MNQDNELGRRIRRLRMNADINQAELAKKLGVSRSAVSLWETGGIGELGGENLINLARALRVDPEFIQTGKGGQHQSAPEERAPTLPREIATPPASPAIVNRGLRDIIETLFGSLDDDQQLDILAGLCRVVSKRR